MACYVGASRAGVRIDVVFRLQKLLDLACMGIELQPLLIVGLRDTAWSNACGLNPGSDVLHGLIRRSKQVMHLLAGEVLSVAGRLWMRSKPSARSW